ncbi:MAG TPA: ABC transporter ATP-binding protein/permease, partial [Nitrospiria bacterium]
MPIIELTQARKTYRMGRVEVPALQDVSLTIEPGEFIAIMGPSGSGKSTLLHLLGLLDVPDGGSYRLFGREVARLDEDELSRMRSIAFGFVFQHFHLLARTTALENVALPLIYHPSARRDASTARRLLEDVGLGDRLTHHSNELSGGQQQRVAIARALVNDPRIILADEPTGNLDSASEREIMQLLERLHERGICVILVTHEPEIAKYADRIIRMRDGRIQSDERVKGAVSRRPAGVPEIGPEAFRPSSRASWTGWIGAAREHLRQAFRSLLANKVRSGLSMLGILIGVSAVVAMLGLGEGAKKSLEKQLASMGSNLLVLRPASRQVQGVTLEAGAVT